ncbi:hypothetical protein GCM10020000_35230 [Streptomyces olivoverticillatus]
MRKMLAEFDILEWDLQTPPDLPYDPVEAEAYLASGQVRDRVTMNCSGKHAAMIAACAANGWPLETYLAPRAPPCSGSCWRSWRRRAASASPTWAPTAAAPP